MDTVGFCSQLPQKKRWVRQLLNRHSIFVVSYVSYLFRKSQAASPLTLSIFVASYVSYLCRKGTAASQRTRSQCQIILLCLTVEVRESARTQTQEHHRLPPPHSPGQLQGRAAWSPTSITRTREIQWLPQPHFGSYQLWGAAPQIGGGNYRQSSESGWGGGWFSGEQFNFWGFGDGAGDFLSERTPVSQFKTVAAVPDEPKRTRQWQKRCHISFRFLPDLLRCEKKWESGGENDKRTWWCWKTCAKLWERWQFGPKIGHRTEHGRMFWGDARSSAAQVWNSRDGGEAESGGWGVGVQQLQQHWQQLRSSGETNTDTGVLILLELSFTFTMLGLWVQRFGPRNNDGQNCLDITFVFCFACSRSLSKT